MGLVEDEVDVERREHSGDGADALEGVGAVAVFVVALHLAEQLVVEALHAHGEAGDAGGAERLEHVGPEVLGVGLDGDLGDAEELLHQLDGGDEFGGFGGRRAAAEVDAGEGVAGGVVEADLVAQGGEVAHGLRVAVLDAVERAERAEHLAERDVDVEVAGAVPRLGRDGARRVVHVQEGAGAETEDLQQVGIDERCIEHVEAGAGLHLTRPGRWLTLVFLANRAHGLRGPGRPEEELMGRRGGAHPTN